MVAKKAREIKNFIIAIVKFQYVGLSSSAKNSHCFSLWFPFHQGKGLGLGRSHRSP